MDAIPNRYSTLWFEAIEPGDHHIFCTEYCGTGHSGMLATVHVLPGEEFDDFLKAGAGRPDGTSPEDWGRDVYRKKACNTCHSLDGSKMTGPTFQGIFGRQERLADGSTVTVDEEYLRRSMVEPNAAVVDGYQPVMPTFSGILTEDDIQSLIAFLKTVQ
jgi:cytochrome c oxidase subunit 2